MRPLVKRYHPLYLYKFNGEIIVIVYDVKMYTETYFTYNDWNTGSYKDEVCVVRRMPPQP
jgi:hypothetical protein